MMSPTNSDQLFIFMPFDVNFELNISGSFSRSMKEQAFTKLRRNLVRCASAYDSNFNWESEDSDVAREEAENIGYNTDDFTADSIRPEYICKAHLRKGSRLFSDCQKPAMEENCTLLGVSIDFHDFGIGVLVAKLGFDPPLKAPVGSILEDFARTLQEPLGSIARKFTSEVFKAVKGCNLTFADETCSLIHRKCKEPSGSESVEARMLWFHSFLQIRKLDTCADIDQWKAQVIEKGRHVKSQHWFDGAFSFRGVVPLNFECRELEAFVLFGWGNTVAFFPEDADSKNARKSFPLIRVLSLLQAFSAGLYLLNREIIYEIIPSIQTSNPVTIPQATGGIIKQAWMSLIRIPSSLFRRPRSRRSIDSYENQVSSINRLRFRTRLFISLLGERRYSYSARQFKLWDGACRAWGMSELQGYIFENLDILRSVFEQKRDEEERRFQNRLNFSLALVSIASVAAVFFDIIIQVFSSGWDSPITVSHYSVLILVALLAYMVAKR